MNELLRASIRGDEVEAKRLLDHGADVNAKNEFQTTPLHEARNEAIVKLLLVHGADVNARDQWQNTPLRLARNGAIMKLLLDHGADVNARDEYQQTPLLHHAWDEAIVKLLLDHGADVNARGLYQKTPLLCAGNVATARLLLNRGAQLTAVDYIGHNALHMAAVDSDLEL